MLRRLFFVAAVSAALTVPALAGPYEDGVAAAYRGDYGTAARLWKPLAEEGNANAQNNLGALYARGLGVKKNDVEAVRLYKLAAEQGNADGEANLAFQYEKGLGVDKDLTLAVSWYRKAAEQLQPTALFSMGLYYAYGVGVEKDKVEAFKWLGLAVSKGGGDARDELAKLVATMTPAEVAEGQKRQTEWRVAHK